MVSTVRTASRVTNSTTGLLSTLCQMAAMAADKTAAVDVTGRGVHRSVVYRTGNAMAIVAPQLCHGNSGVYPQKNEQHHQKGWK